MKSLKALTPALLIKQIELGAEVLPQDSPEEIGIQIGRFQFVRTLKDLDEEQRRRLEQLYRAGRIRFGYPGDFTVRPFFFHCEPATRQTRL